MIARACSGWVSVDGDLMAEYDRLRAEYRRVRTQADTGDASKDTHAVNWLRAEIARVHWRLFYTPPEGRGRSRVVTPHPLGSACESVPGIRAHDLWGRA